MRFASGFGFEATVRGRKDGNVVKKSQTSRVGGEQEYYSLNWGEIKSDRGRGEPFPTA